MVITTSKETGIPQAISKPAPALLVRALAPPIQKEPGASQVLGTLN